MKIYAPNARRRLFDVAFACFNLGSFFPEGIWGWSSSRSDDTPSLGYVLFYGNSYDRSFFKKFPVVGATWKSVTMFSVLRHGTLTWATWIQSRFSFYIYLWSILLLSYQLGLLARWFPNKGSVCVFHFSRACYMLRPSHLLDLVTLRAFDKE
jgi:hypothetical protein